MRLLATLLLILLPGFALAASGGSGEGFGLQDWLAKWPVLLIVVCVVAGTTSFLSVKVFRRARALKGHNK
ncbi:MAG: hypothetical protein VX874_08225 [Pseudomonadota bacterium]|nr:hypothetical protein [Pseudomonadota bacterium]